MRRVPDKEQPGDSTPENEENPLMGCACGRWTQKDMFTDGVCDSCWRAAQRGRA